jgi:hypothetical protein
MGGTSDVDEDVEWATSEENLPFDRDPAAGLDHNAHLVQLAQQAGAVIREALLT